MSHFYLIFFRLNFLNFRIKKGQTKTGITKSDPDDPERPKRPFKYSVGRMGHSGSSGSFSVRPTKTLHLKIMILSIETF